MTNGAVTITLVARPRFQICFGVLFIHFGLSMVYLYLSWRHPQRGGAGITKGIDYVPAPQARRSYASWLDSYTQSYPHCVQPKARRRERGSRFSMNEVTHISVLPSSSITLSTLFCGQNELALRTTRNVPRQVEPSLGKLSAEGGAAVSRMVRNPRAPHIECDGCSHCQRRRRLYVLVHSTIREA